MSAFTGRPFASVAPFLAEYGYPPVPIPPGRKGPNLPDWQVPREPSHYLPFVDPETGRKTDCSGYGTGILTARCPAIDLDIRDREVVRALVELADNMLGVAPFRVGAPPKVIMLYGADCPFDKIIGRWWALPGEDFETEGYVAHRIEVLGRGQQFVAFARHPRGTFYRWRRYSPMSLMRDVLVPIYEAEARAYLAAAERVLHQLGARPIRLSGGRWVLDQPRPEPARRLDRREWPPAEWQMMAPGALARRIDPRHARRTRQGWLCSCPAHRSEGHRSLSINPRDGGGSLVKCWADCPFPDIARAIESIVGRAG